MTFVSMVDTPNFLYAPLNGTKDGQRAFRLLTITPDTERAPIKCQLENVLWDDEPTIRRTRNYLSSQPSPSLARKPRKSAAQFRRRTKSLRRRHGQDSFSIIPNAYEALSYAWDNQRFEAQISLNEQPFKVMPTLEQALHRLRDPEQPRKIWIDAICIDQENPEEKVDQIRQMQNIFADAVQVIVWLGERSADSDEGFMFAKKLSELGLAEGGLEANDFSDVVPIAAKELLFQSHIPSWSALHRLLSRTWWLRAWVVQEVVAAKSVTFLCGGTFISWKELSQAVIITRHTYDLFRLLKNAPSQLINSEYYFISNNTNCQAAFNLVSDR